MGDDAMKRLLLPLAAAALLSACGTGGPSKVVVQAGAPKPAKGMDWTFAPVGDDAALTYGAPGGTDAKLLLACSHHSGNVTIGQPVASLPEGTTNLTLVSGSVKSVDLGQVQALPSNPDQQVLAVQFPMMAPIIQAFWDRGWISVPTANDRLTHMVPHPGNHAVKQFFAFCN
jgi:hypothetical protein